MVAPMATFRNYGHRPAALEIANRSLKEREPGIYSGTVRFPVAGKYDVAFLLDSPRIVHCFADEGKEDPSRADKGAAGPSGPPRAFSKSGAYSVYVVAPSLKVGHLALPYFTLIAEEDGKSPAT